MARLLDLFGYLSVILRALTLATQSLVIGGVSFTLLAALPLKPALGAGLEPLLKSSRRLIAWSAVGLALTWSILLFVDSAVLMHTADLQFAEVVGANFFLAGSSAVICGAVIAVLTRSSSRGSLAAMAPFSILLLATSVATSHAASRVDNSIVLVIITGVHHLATGTWIGGMPYLLVSLRAAGSDQDAALISSRFSRIALTSVILLAVAGVAMSVFYVGSVESLYGTAYGVMVMAKVALFVLLLPLGALNFLIFRQASTNGGRMKNNKKRYIDVKM